jgi:hypothetical protein
VNKLPNIRIERKTSTKHRKHTATGWNKNRTNMVRELGKHGKQMGTHGDTMGHIFIDFI